MRRLLVVQVIVSQHSYSTLKQKYKEQTTDQRNNIIESRNFSTVKNFTGFKKETSSKYTQYNVNIDSGTPYSHDNGTSSNQIPVVTPQ